MHCFSGKEIVNEEFAKLFSTLPGNMPAGINGRRLQEQHPTCRILYTGLPSYDGDGEPLAVGYPGHYDMYRTGAAPTIFEQTADRHQIRSQQTYRI